MVLFVLCGSILGKLYYMWKNVFLFSFFWLCLFIFVKDGKKTIHSFNI